MPCHEYGTAVLQQTTPYITVTWDAWPSRPCSGAQGSPPTLRCSCEARPELAATLDRLTPPAGPQVLKKVAERGELVGAALNTHGTRAVQKLIETLSSREQRAIAIEALRPGVVSLIKDLNGNHVVQRCLQRLGPEDSQFIYDAAVAHCVEVATHRHGCCVLQRCIDFATPPQKQSLVLEVAKHSLVLSQVRCGLHGCGLNGLRLGAWGSGERWGFTPAEWPGCGGVVVVVVMVVCAAEGRGRTGSASESGSCEHESGQSHLGRKPSRFTWTIHPFPCQDFTFACCEQDFV